MPHSFQELFCWICSMLFLYTFGRSWLFHYSVSVICYIVWFFFLQYWDLNTGPSPWAIPPALFCEFFFKDRVSLTVFLGWLQTIILLTFASWVTRIIGVSYQAPSYLILFFFFFLNQVYWNIILMLTKLPFFISVSLISILIVLCDHHHYITSEQFYHQLKKL
jgi:hypothetical protein